MRGDQVGGFIVIRIPIDCRPLLRSSSTCTKKVGGAKAVCGDLLSVVSLWLTVR